MTNATSIKWTPFNGEWTDGWHEGVHLLTIKKEGKKKYVIYLLGKTFLTGFFTTLQDAKDFLKDIGC